MPRRPHHQTAACSDATFVLGMSEPEVEIFLDAVVAMAEPVKTHLPS